MNKEEAAPSMRESESERVAEMCRREKAERETEKGKGRRYEIT
jgi:hypothetical protein